MNDGTDGSGVVFSFVCVNAVLMEMVCDCERERESACACEILLANLLFTVTLCIRYNTP